MNRHDIDPGRCRHSEATNFMIDFCERNSKQSTPERLVAIDVDSGDYAIAQIVLEASDEAAREAP